MRVLVAGRTGQLARALAETRLADGGWRVDCLGRPDLDLADPGSIRAAVAAARPDIVVNAAAYTAVDRAEAEPDAAFAINRDGAGALAGSAAACGAAIVHLSTDYVFAGDGTKPYLETDPVGPLGVYGRSKLAGEEAVAAANPRHVIVRTAWVHSPWGGNFVRTMLRLGAERAELRVVGDQTGTPTYAPDLAAAIIAVCDKVASMPPASPLPGIYHLTNSGVATWHDLAAEIFRLAAAKGRKTPNLVRITTAEYPMPAERPRYSVLDNGRARAAFGLRMRDWRAGVADCVSRLIDAQDGNSAAAG